MTGLTEYSDKFPFAFSFQKHGVGVLLLFIGLMLTGCVTPGSISIGKVQTTDYAMKSLRTLKADLLIPVSNQSRYRLKIRKYEAMFYYDGDLFGAVTGKNEIVIPPLTDSLYIVPVEITYKRTLTDGIKVLSRFLVRENLVVDVSGHISGCLAILPFRRSFQQEAVLRRRN